MTSQNEQALASTVILSKGRRTPIANNLEAIRRVLTEAGVNWCSTMPEKPPASPSSALDTISLDLQHLMRYRIQ